MVVKGRTLKLAFPLNITRNKVMGMLRHSETSKKKNEEGRMKKEGFFHQLGKVKRLRLFTEKQVIQRNDNFSAYLS